MLPGNEIVLVKDKESESTHFSNMRFPRRPRALLLLALFAGLGRGATVGGSAAGVVTGSSGFLASGGADSVGGAEIKALIWKKGRKLLRYLELYEAETFHTASKRTYPLRLVWWRVGQHFFYNQLNGKEGFQQ